MKRLLIMGSLMAVLVSSAPATSAGPYTIEAGGEAHAYWFGAMYPQCYAGNCVHQGCEDSPFYDSPLNGITERLVNIRAFAGKRIKFTWRAEHYFDSLAAPAYLRGGYVSTACSYITAFGAVSRFDSPAYFNIPTNAKWLWVTGLAWAKASFTIVLAPAT